MTISTQNGKYGNEMKQTDIIVSDAIRILEKRLWEMLLLILAALANSIISLFVVGWPFVPISFLFNAWTFWVGLRAYMKVREISR